MLSDKSENASHSKTDLCKPKNQMSDPCVVVPEKNVTKVSNLATFVK